MLLASVSLTAFTSPVNGAPDQETASSPVSISHSIVNDGPEARFGFSVLAQAATSVFKAQTSGTAGTLVQGTPTTFSVTLSGFQNSFVAGNQLMVDVVWPNFTVVSATPAAAGAGAATGGTCAFTQGTNSSGVTAPAGSTSILCTAGAAGGPGGPNTSAVYTITLVPNVGGLQGNQIVDQACAANGAGQGVACEQPLTANVTINPQITTATATPTATNTTTATVTSTPTATRTPTVIASPTPGQPSGTPGVPCSTPTGLICPVAGPALNGTFNPANNTFSLTVTAPAGSGAGTVFVTLPTINNPGGETFACQTPSLGAGTSLTCTGTTTSALLLGGTVTATVPNATPGGAPITVTATTGAGTNTTTGTLVICKQISFPLGLGGINPLGPLGGPGFGLNGLNGLNGLGLQASTVTFTTVPAVTIPAITVPAGTTTAVCATGVPIAAGQVTITENVPVGFTLASVTGGTLSGTTNAATATITTGQVTTVTFVNQPVTVINNPLPLLPPPPLQFIPPPPPPLLPPPPPAPMGGMMAAASPMASVPVIPEADSIFLVVGGLVALGAIAGLRSLRRRRDDEV